MLPEDVLILILLWLPVATLCQFKSVCKSWYTLIQNPNFIIQHYNHLHFPSLSNNDENLLVVNNPHLNISLCSGYNNFHVSEIFEPPLPVGKDPPIYLELNTSYNGVICLQYGKLLEYFSLYNPTLKEFTILPDLPVLENIPQSVYIISGGFGFDCVHNDYKVVSIAGELIPYSYTKIKTNQVDVYSLTANCWRTIDAVLPVTLKERRCNTPVRCGRYYCWLADVNSPVQERTSHYTILSFDFSKEAFEVIQLPDVYDICANLQLELTLFDDNIAFIETVATGEGYVPDKFVFNVWLMNEYGVKESWTKLYTICLENVVLPNSYSITPTTFLKNGDIIWLNDMWADDKTTLNLWDHVTKELKILPDQLDSYIYFDQVVSYKESLLSFRAAGSRCK